HSKFQTFNIVKIDPDHPSATPVPEYWERSDESYYLTELNPDIHIILATDLTSIDDDKAHQEYPANTFGKYFPVTWCHSFDGGHQWYTSLGHNPEHYDDPVFMNHILGGIQWVLEARSN
ncbi:MAG TPA: ThuA domain-containing protein, partial [Membranihabitans sp.]|nr:ThuA domain-containing protein [Membranihabitans sp.]